MGRRGMDVVDRGNARGGRQRGPLLIIGLWLSCPADPALDGGQRLGHGDVRGAGESLLCGAGDWQLGGCKPATSGEYSPSRLGVEGTPTASSLSSGIF
jgi:hypothetical protein